MARKRKVDERIVGGVTLKLVHCLDWDEYEVRWYDNGVYNVMKSYYTTDKSDAVGTLKAMAARLTAEKGK